METVTKEHRRLLKYQLKITHLKREYRASIGNVRQLQQPASQARGTSGESEIPTRDSEAVNQVPRPPIPPPAEARA